MKIYLASPFFNEEELDYVDRAEKILRKRGYEVYSPREHEVRDETVGTANWSIATFEADRIGIDKSNIVVMLYHGNYSDSGTAWECGYAYGTNTPVVVVHIGTNSNLMVHEGSHSNISFDELATYDFEKMPKKRYEGEMI